VIPFGIDELALGDGQVAWIGTTGGNETEVIVTAAKLAGGKPKDVDDLGYESNSGEGDDAKNLLGGGSVLAYNRIVNGREQLARIANGRFVVVRRGAPSSLVAAGGGRMAVASAGALTVLAARGSHVTTVRTAQNSRGGVALGSAELAVRRVFDLDVTTVPRGKRTRSIRLGASAGSNLAGVNGKVALLVGDGNAVLVRLRDGKLISLPLPHGFVDARLTDAGLFYAYDTPKAAKKGHVVFEPTARLLRRF
jgi:hypothetical protein